MPAYAAEWALNAAATAGGDTTKNYGLHRGHVATRVAERGDQVASTALDGSTLLPPASSSSALRRSAGGR